MPRIRRDVGDEPRLRFPNLVAELAAELKSDRESGQPIIEEQRFPRSNAIHATVIWDKWDPIPDEERTDIILQAYEQAEGKEFRDRIALAMGLTVPEASDSGTLPFQVICAVRKNDPVTIEQCRDAMLAEGASVLRDPAKPQLRFSTVEEAEQAIRRLTQRLPGSEPVWIMQQEVSSLS